MPRSRKVLDQQLADVSFKRVLRWILFCCRHPAKPARLLVDRLKRLVESGLLTREDTRAGQRARYSLTKPADATRTRVRAARQAGDFANGPPALRCAFAPSCSNKAAPRSGRSSWTNCATRTLAPSSQRDHRAFASA
jgi:hypothetical protein